MGIGRSIVHLHGSIPHRLDAEASYPCRKDFASSIKSNEEPLCAVFVTFGDEDLTWSTCRSAGQTGIVRGRPWVQLAAEGGKPVNHARGFNPPVHPCTGPAPPANRVRTDSVG
jgi:hypothetical protein